MKFKLDENLPVDLGDILRQAGHEVTTVLDESLGGEDDPQIASVCQQEQRVLVTLDLGFADIRTYPPAQYWGLLVLRVQNQKKPTLFAALQRILPLLQQENLEHHLWIVEEDRIRIRE